MMKTRNYIVIVLLAILLPTVSLRCEEITGVSDPFVFGAPVVPISSLPILVVFCLVILFVFRRYYIINRRIA